MRTTNNGGQPRTEGSNRPAEPDTEAITGQYITVELDGIEVNYYDEGEGDLLVLLHGGGLTSCARLNWGAVATSLGDNFRVISIDQPGFGYTPPRGPEDYYQENRAEFVVEMLKMFSFESFNIAGNSEGAWIAAYIALEYPNLVDTLTIVNSGSITRKRPQSESPPDTSSPEPAWNEIKEELLQLRENYFVNPENHPFYQRPITDEKVDWFYELKKRHWKFNNERTEAIRGTIAKTNEHTSYNGKHMSECADQLEVPTLMTWSSHPYHVFVQSDEPLKLGEQEGRYDAGISFFDDIEHPDSEMHIWHEAKHHPMTDQSTRWVDVVTDFVSHFTE
jgi:pimeloyl-ACP methyl ester carboxylesterase